MYTYFEELLFFVRTLKVLHTETDIKVKNVS